MNLNSVKGIGPKTIELLNKLSINTIDDLVRYYPYRYNIYRPVNILETSEEDTAVLTGKIAGNVRIYYINRSLNKITFPFETSNIICSVTIFNRAFIKRLLVTGKEITIIGKYNKQKNSFIASDIKLTPIKKTIVEPVYHMVHGLKNATLVKAIHSILSSDYFVQEIIPPTISDKYQLMDTKQAIRELHNPTELNSLKKAKLKLKYEELFEFMFKINLMKLKNEIFESFIQKEIKDEDVESLIKEIPFTLTTDQKKALDEIVNDFRDTRRMNRLLLGDVGSGKTIVAFLAILLNLKAGYQSALLAPTEVLATQHYQNFLNMFEKLNIKVSLLVGSQKKSNKEKIIEDLRNGDIDILIGTHAILEERVEFNNIGLVITDEQHRFGVNQRRSLQNKGHAVDVIYMSATPIPRTYALTIYGDMDISMIKEKPLGRKEIITKSYTFDEIKNVAALIDEEINENHQVYVVAPLIEENEDSELNDIMQIENTLKKYLKSKYSIGIMHGKMKPKEKDEIMNAFKEGNIQILLATTVIEVGVDVKNATMMIIFNAERFGLSTLHQLRGRVGRNSLQSRCILLSDKKTERLKVLEESNDGFYISEQDFILRGSGDLFGVRQSGDMIFKIADIKTDYRILLQCKMDSEEFLKENIENNFRDYSYYKKIVNDLMNND